MATRIRRRRSRVMPMHRRLRSASSRASNEPQVVDLTCTGDDDEVYDLTDVSESPIVFTEHSPIVISDTPGVVRPVRPTAAFELSDLAPLQLADSENEELPIYSCIVSTSHSSDSSQTQSSTVSCPICFDSLAQIRARNIQLVSTKCGHVFCQQCIDDLLRERSTTAPCPTCRKTVSKKSVHPIYI